MSERIRAATLDDVDALGRLRWEFRIEQGTPATTSYDVFLEGFRAFARDALDGGTWLAWLAEDDERGPVGCVWLQLVEKVPHPGRARGERPIGYLSNMYVDVAHRNAGLGRRLLDTAVDRAREIGVDGVLLWPSERSEPFYRRSGFVPTGWLWLEAEGD